MNIGYYKGSRERTIESICGKELKKKTNTHHSFYLNLENTGEEIIKYLNSLIEERNRAPKFLEKLSQRQFEVFLKQVIVCDGTDKGSDTWATIYGRKEMLEDLQALCIKNNISARFNVYRGKDYRLYVNIGKEL